MLLIAELASVWRVPQQQARVHAFRCWVRIFIRPYKALTLCFFVGCCILRRFVSQRPEGSSVQKCALLLDELFDGVGGLDTADAAYGAHDGDSHLDAIVGVLVSVCVARRSAVHSTSYWLCRYVPIPHACACANCHFSVFLFSSLSLPVYCRVHVRISCHSKFQLAIGRNMQQSEWWQLWCSSSLRRI